MEPRAPALPEHSRIEPRRAGSPMPLGFEGVSLFCAPEGQLTIARRFNAGFEARRKLVAKGRLTVGFSRLFGTRCSFIALPALKRRAIIGGSLRDDEDEILVALELDLCTGLHRIRQRALTI